MWDNPVELKLVETDQSESFKTMPYGCTGLPVGDHPGSFGFKRQFHTHEGIDLYVPDGHPVHAVEDGQVVAIAPFTGEHAGSPWWNNTWAIMVEGLTGVVCYGEIEVLPEIKIDDQITAGSVLGHVKTVLTKYKGRPMAMLHLELYDHGTREPLEWGPNEDKPETLRDPTSFLLPLAK